MTWKALVAQLANRINQPYVIDTYMRQVFRAGVITERNHNSEIDIPEDIDYSPFYCGRTCCCRNHESYLPENTCDKVLCRKRIPYPKNDIKI